MYPLCIDIETRSRLDLRKCGVYRYAADPSTMLLCAAWKWTNQQEIHTFDARKGSLPHLLIRALKDAPKRGIWAWNAQFERLVLNGIYDLELKIEQFECMASRARSCGLPGKLELAPQLLNLPKPEWKDHRGDVLIRKCSIPNKKTGDFECTGKDLDDCRT